MDPPVPYHYSLRTYHSLCITGSPKAMTLTSDPLENKAHQQTLPMKISKHIYCMKMNKEKNVSTHLP